MGGHVGVSHIFGIVDVYPRNLAEVSMTGTVVAGAAVAFAHNTDIPSALSVGLPKSSGKGRHDMCQNYYSAAFTGSRHTANAVGFH